MIKQNALSLPMQNNYFYQKQMLEYQDKLFL